MNARAHNDLVIFSQDVVRAADEHVERVRQASGNEAIGSLFGLPFVTPAGLRGVWVAVFEPLEPEIATPTRVQAGPEAYAAAWPRADRRWMELGLGELGRGPVEVGWVHSHPSMPVFLSQDDLDNVAARFTNPYQISYVLGPPEPARAVFGWDEELSTCRMPLAARVWVGTDVASRLRSQAVQLSIDVGETR